MASISFLHEQQQTEGLAKLTLVLFDDEYLVPINGLPVAEIRAAQQRQLCPAGEHRLARRDRPDD